MLGKESGIVTGKPRLFPLKTDIMKLIFNVNI